MKSASARIAPTYRVARRCARRDLAHVEAHDYALLAADLGHPLEILRAAIIEALDVPCTKAVRAVLQARGKVTTIRVRVRVRRSGGTRSDAAGPNWGRRETGTTLRVVWWCGGVVSWCGVRVRAKQCHAGKDLTLSRRVCAYGACAYRSLLDVGLILDVPRNFTIRISLGQRWCACSKRERGALGLSIGWGDVPGQM